MKTDKALKLFISDNLPLLLTVFLTQVFFFSALFYIKKIWIEEVFYFSFLVFFVLVSYLVLRFYQRKRVYEKFFLKSDVLSDYLIQDTRSSFEKSYNLMIDEMIQMDNKSKIEQKQEKKLQKVMIYRFVHQMKTPISVLKLICENHGDEDEFIKIQRNINALQYNLNQMLDIYRLEDFKKDFVSEKVYLKSICKDCINALKDYFITSQIYPKLEIDEEAYVYSDSKWLKLVIHQILSNAVKYSNKGQSIMVKADKRDEKMILSIIDEGIGIEEADLKNIFELFYIGKNGRNNADSSGIGLYIVKRVVEYLGHEVKISSKIDEGTRLSIEF
jgi:two component sensor histidine kinase